MLRARASRSQGRATQPRSGEMFIVAAPVLIQSDLSEMHSISLKSEIVG